MGCFRQIFRCFKAPFTRKQRVIEISRPTDFRREELPACFSDAESVLSPSQTTTERPTLTKQSQNVDVSGQPRTDGGEGRHDDRDGRSLAIVDDKDSVSPKPSHPNIMSRLRSRMSASYWFKVKPATSHEQGP
ncbi:hypothetical protein N7492_006206 [Penicillium capsulatum]|uniref:Uncharacterized protein n=1 Tax=Penicillium capsulatum TaxID=69766 RepID=A0A9W9LMG0_9EURO|nr:hypothetical protein N7492_006206 [Penicillium capsulatum]KAJ6108859.1 hypothetical protein N7512_008696 [Penicillium capsulatum]